METRKQIENEEQQRAWRYERAFRYERLCEEVVRLRVSIERLEALDVDLKALKSIQKLAADVPPNLQTRGNRFISGGFIVRDMLQVIAADALADATRKQQATQAVLIKARTDLSKAEAAVKAVESEK